MPPKFHKKKTVLQNAKKKTGAKAQSKQIQRLARQVDSVRESTREQTVPINYRCGYSSRSDPSVTQGAPLIIPLTSGPKSGTTGTATTNNTPADLMNWVKWGSFPGAAVNTQLGNLKLYSQYIDLIVSPGGEVDLLNHTLFLVQLRDDGAGMARQTYIRTGSMSSLTLDLDYTDNPDNAGSQVWLNPLLYKIHKRIECFTAGNTNEPIASDTGIVMQNHSGGYNRYGMKISYGGRHLRATERSAEIQSITYNDIPPEYKYFIIAFSDNSPVDLENPLISVSSTISARMF